MGSSIVKYEIPLAVKLSKCVLDMIFDLLQGFLGIEEYFLHPCNRRSVRPVPW